MAYRAPSVNELYLDFVNTGYAVRGNPDLEAETSNSFEVGANFEFDDISGRVTAYHSRYKNFIDQTSTTDPVYGFLTQYENLDRVHISGFEFSLRKDFANGFFVHGAAPMPMARTRRPVNISAPSCRSRAWSVSDTSRSIGART